MSKAILEKLSRLSYVKNYLHACKSTWPARDRATASLEPQMKRRRSADHSHT